MYVQQYTYTLCGIFTIRLCGENPIQVQRIYYACVGLFLHRHVVKTPYLYSRYYVLLYGNLELLQC